MGRNRPKVELVRFVLDGDELVRDPGATLPGRGAYLCPDRECAEKALRDRGFNRSFRRPLSRPDNALDFTDRWQRSESTR